MNSPGAPSEPSRLTASTCSRTSGCTASGSTCGEPSVTSPQTRSGRRTASTLAMLPPRLWPITTARWPCSATRRSSRCSSRSCPAPAQPTLARIPARDGPVAGAAQPVAHQRQRAVAGHEARDQQRRAPAAVARARRRAGSGRAAAPRPRARHGPPATAADATRDERQSLHREHVNLVPRAARFRARAAGDDPGRAARGRGAPRPRARPRRGAGARAGRPGLNGADMLQLRGALPRAARLAADIPGLELAGEVAAARPRRRALRGRRPGHGRGRRRRPGGAGDRARARRDAGAGRPRLARRPAGSPRCSPPPTTRSSRQAELRPGEHLLVHGAAGGVGTAAVQLGREAGARVTATRAARGAARRRSRSSAPGRSRPEGFAEHGPFDVVLELVGRRQPGREPAVAGHRRPHRRDRRGRERARWRRSTCSR